MARTVDTSSTFENWRQNYNDLASDVGGLGSLTTADKSSVVNAINYIMDQYFYFQDFEFDGSDGATSNTVFSGTDNAGNTFAYSAGKLLVFKNGLLLRSGTDYTAVNGTSVTLASSANNGDIIRMSVFTGSYENVGAASSATSNQWILAGSTIYNQNIGGVVINADSTITTTLGVADSIQLQGNTYANGSIYLNAQNDLRFQDSDSSHYAAIQAPATISANYTLTLPADDGTSGQTLQTDGSGVLTWASATATDVNVVANNSANETVYPIFVDGATGSQGVESDTGLTYNPSSGTLTSTVFVGALTGNSSTATVLASNRNFSLTGNVTASAIAFNGSGAVALSTTLANDVVNSQHYVDGSIDTAHIADSQITQAKMASDSVTAANIVDNSVGAAELNVSGNGSATQALLSDGDGTFSWGSSGHTTEELQDIIGAMFSSNTETRISATYQDGDGTIDLVVDDMTANTTYSVGDGGLTEINFTSADNTKLDGIAASATNTAAPHYTSAIAVGDGGLTQNNFTNADHSKLDGLVTNATHTGDVTGSGALTIAAGAVDLAMLSASGTRNSATFYRGDGTFAVPAYVANTDTNYYLSNITNSGNTYTWVMSGTTDRSIAFGSNAFNSTAFTTNTGTLTDVLVSNGCAISGSGSERTVSMSGAYTGTFAVTGGITASADITAYASSDIALKENIINIPNPLEKISKIGGYMFDWTDHGMEGVHGEGHDTGIIAQEIENILPEIVNTRESGMKAVNYMKLIPLLIESIKELKSELDELKSSNS